MNFDEAVCPACRFSAVTGGEVAVRPPRADHGPSDDFELAPLKLRRQRYLTPWRWWHLALAELLPGVGHLLDRQPRMALYCAGGVGVLVLAAMWLSSATATGLLLGLAASLHAWAIFDHTPWRRDDSIFRRMAALITILLLLYIVVYRALAVLLVPLVLVANRQRHEVAAGWFNDMLPIILFAVAVLVCLWIWRRRV